MESRPKKPDRKNYIFCQTIDQAAVKKQDCIIVGDANLCTEKWDDKDFLHKNVAEILRTSLDQNGLKVNNIGITYTADHTQMNNTIAESAIDHVYNSHRISKKLTINKLNNNASDHLPVLVKYEPNNTSAMYTKGITKRSLIFFSKDKWIEILNRKDWSKLNASENIDANPSKLSSLSLGFGDL